MRIASILYFSGTGNTWWASEKLAELLKNSGYEAVVLSIESKQSLINRAINESELIFLNYPIYGSDRPEIVKEFINNLPPANDKPFGIICTQLAFSGDGAWLEHESIESKGYRIRWTMHLRMPNNISIPGFPFLFTNDRKKLDKKLLKAESVLKKLAAAVSSGSEWKQGRSRLSNMLGLMQRRPYRAMLPGLRDDQSIDPESCIRCGKCIKYCPVGNIRFAPEETGGFPEFQGECILCLRCYNFCPTQAVLYRNKKFVPKRGSRQIPYQGPVSSFSPEIVKPTD